MGWNAAVLMPLSLVGQDSIDRQRARDFVRDRLREAVPSMPIVVGRCDANDWSKGKALARARSYTDTDVLIVHDADVFVDPEALLDAIDIVKHHAPWAIPHREVFRLTHAATEQLYDGVQTASYARYPYVGYVGGGITVVRAEVWDECPVDPRFMGWGSEDECWGWALRCLYGDPWRGDAPLTHLWHEPLTTRSGHNEGPDGPDLRRAYRAAKNRPDRMRVILDGAHRVGASHG